MTPEATCANKDRIYQQKVNDYKITVCHNEWSMVCTIS